MSSVLLFAVNNDAVKLSSELIYLFVLGKSKINIHNGGVCLYVCFHTECAYRSSAQAKVATTISIHYE